MIVLTVQNTRNFSEQGANPLCTVRNLNIEQFFDRKRVTEFISHCNGPIGEAGICGATQSAYSLRRSPNDRNTGGLEYRSYIR